MTRHTWRLAPPAPAPTVPALDPEQRAVVAWARGPALVVGAAGSGRTTALLEAVAARIEAGDDPASVLVLCSSRAAAARMRAAVAVRMPGREAPWIGTPHALALQVVARVAGVEEPPRLLSGAEQEHDLREVLEGSRVDGLAEPWPPSLQEALGTRGFTREVRAAVAAARGLGLAGDELVRMGRAAGEPAWAAVGALLDVYLEAQEHRGTLDYAELLYRAVLALQDPGNAALFAHLRSVYVDEYEECDRMQVALLAALAHHAERLVATANPDAAVFAFRGADPRAVRDFPERFTPMARAHGFEAPAVLRLGRVHRYGSRIRDYATDVFEDTVPLDLPRPVADLHRRPGARDGGSVRAVLYDDTGAQAAHVASRVRALLDDGADPAAIAVIARSVAGLGPVERALHRIGVPARTDVRSGRLVDQPAVRTLVRALEVVARPNLVLDPVHAHELLVSPLCGLDASEVRALARILRTDRAVPADQALADALGDAGAAPHLPDGLPGARALLTLRALLHRAHARVLAGDSPHAVLWLLWSGTGWPEHLRRLAIDQAAAAAHRDLDAVCELFDVAERAVLRHRGHVGVAAFVADLLGQQVPADTLARRGDTGPAVELLTAHAAKGREWAHVFVVDVTEGVWPDLRRRSPILDVDRLDPNGLGAPPGRQARYDEERRLFHVACTRATTSLEVSGTLGLRADDAQPSRFLDNRVVPAVPIGGRPHRLDGVDDIVARLRRTATSTTSGPALRDAAVRRLHALAALRDDSGQPLFPEADPDRWWGMRAVTEAATPVVDPAAPLYVRGSSLDTLGNCGLRWFLDQRVHAETPRGTAVVFGSALHALADGVVRGALPADVPVLAAELRSAWNAAGYDAAWQSERDFAAGVETLARFVHWHTPRAGRVVHSEVTFDGVVDVTTPAGRVERLRMRGSIDRIEIVDDRHVVVFDYKTGRGKYGNQAVADSGQLRFYQLAVARGLVGEGLTPDGGAFVHLRVPAGARDAASPAVQEQPPLDPADPWVTDVLGAALDTVRSEQFTATPGGHCDTCAMRAACPAVPEGRFEGA